MAYLILLLRHAGEVKVEMIADAADSRVVAGHGDVLGRAALDDLHRDTPPAIVVLHSAFQVANERTHHRSSEFRHAAGEVRHRQHHLLANLVWWVNQMLIVLVGESRRHKAKEAGKNFGVGVRC